MKDLRAQLRKWRVGIDLNPVSWVNLPVWLSEMARLREKESSVIPGLLPDFFFGDEFMKLFLVLIFFSGIY